MVMRGLSEASGSWKTICIRERMRRISSVFNLIEIDVIKEDMAGGGLEQAQDQSPNGGFARAAFACQAKYLTLLDV